MLSNRIVAIEEFLQQCNLQDYYLKQLPADASFRQYYKVIKAGERELLLMDCPPEHYTINPFLLVAGMLSDLGARVPKIYEYDEHQGFVLLECFAGPIIGTILDKDNLTLIYKTLLEILIAIQQNFTRHAQLEIYTPEKYLEELEIYLNWYVTDQDHILRAEFINRWHEVIASLPIITPTFCHLDFHVENLMLVSGDVSDISRSNVGIIDFQDARIASPIYDVVSLLEDARFELSTEYAQELFSYYLSLRPELDLEDASIHYHILGAQRNMRILGVFARKAKRDNDHKYLNYMPRLRNYLQHDLTLPALTNIRDIYQRFEDSQ